MSERGRSPLFGRPSELLVDEPAPRIAMPAPPLRLRAPEITRMEAPPPEPTDEDELPVMGPLQVFVGPTTPIVDMIDDGPVPPRSPDIRLPSRIVTVLPETPPGMFSDAVDELGSAFGGGPSPAPPKPPTRSTTEPGIRLSVRTGASTRASMTEVLPEAPVVQQRGQGIATAAAARGRAPRAEPISQRPFDDEENTSLSASPFQAFDAPRTSERAGAARSSEAPPWDDPRFRRADPSESSFVGAARIPAPPPDYDQHINEPTQPVMGLSPFGDSPLVGLETVAPPPPRTKPVVTAPVSPPQPVITAAAPYGQAAPAPAAPAAKGIARWRPNRRLLRTLAVTTVLLLAGLGAWRWTRTHPDALAAMRGRVSAVFAPRAPVAAPPLLASVPSADAPAANEAGPAVAVDPEGLVTPSEAAPAEAAPTDATLVVAAVEPPPEAVPPPTPVSLPPPAPVAEVAPKVPNVAERRGHFQSATGTLQVVCDRRATIYVDNVRMGSTSDDEPLEIVAGTHHVRVVANGRSRSMDVRIDAGRPSMVKFEFR